MGLAQVLHAGHAAGAEVGAAHQQRIELHAAVARQEGAAARVEGLVVFHHHDGRFDRIERRAAALKDRVSGLKRIADTSPVRGDFVVRHGPGAAVDQKSRVGHGCIVWSRKRKGVKVIRAASNGCTEGTWHAWDSSTSSLSMDTLRCAW